MSHSLSHVLLLILLVARTQGTCPQRLRCIVFYESSFRVDAIGAAGEVGLGQIKPATGAFLLEQALADPAVGHLFVPLAERPLTDPLLNLRLVAWGQPRYPRWWSTTRLCVE